MKHIWMTGLTAVLFSSVVYADDAKPSVDLDQRGDRIEQRLDNRGDRKETRLDNKGDRIEERLDDKGDRIEDRLDNRADKADAKGHENQARSLAQSR